MKVYIVTSGIYSGYEIEAVFSTKEKAQSYIDIHGDYNNREIEEYDMDVESLERKTSVYEVYIYVNGSEVRVNNNLIPDTIQASTVYHSFERGLEFNYRLTIETDGAERAKKVASERIAQVKAMPYLFPRLHAKCVGHKSASDIWNFPTYNFLTKEIILRNGEFLKDEKV